MKTIQYKRHFLIAISFLLLVGCQNTTVTAMAEPASKNIEKTLPQQAIKLEKLHDSKPEDTEVYSTSVVEIFPKYPGGINKFYAFIKKNYVIPQELMDDEASRGGIFVNMIIEKDGSLSAIKVLRDFGYGSGKELGRVIKLSPNWIPAIKDGNPVRCLYSIPYYVQ
ncbi:hypothetical protein B0A67_00720 [Flavobacterium aquidurense]|jgi:hypothetical protein|uniref:energy transducer TonB n=1 Tax=Flavobacterium aquidurense TaxID=362413 RepID=UPI00091AA929|nr:hypothetical protein [Flavobacterium aquidurense]OXA74338.1 hypothetical protein B0A67_00720 [Flavobacterium aquidurense]SHF93145.1 hypothetical protein SAMN05444481_101143 [Flavobacterium frigidimaris]